MRTIEEVVADKLIGLIDFLLSKIIKPDITVNNIRQLNETEIDRIKQKYGIEGIILDVDETLRKEMKDIPECNKQWIESLNGKLKVVILSNGIDKKIENYFKENDINYIGFAQKPLKKNFTKACEIMNINPEKVLVLGDSLIDDIYGGKRNKMKTVLVKDVEERN